MGLCYFKSAAEKCCLWSLQNDWNRGSRSISKCKIRKFFKKSCWFSAVSSWGCGTDLFKLGHQHRVTYFYEFFYDQLEFQSPIRLVCCQCKADKIYLLSSGKWQLDESRLMPQSFSSDSPINRLRGGIVISEPFLRLCICWLCMRGRKNQFASHVLHACEWPHAAVSVQCVYLWGYMPCVPFLCLYGRVSVPMKRTQQCEGDMSTDSHWILQWSTYPFCCARTHTHTHTHTDISGSSSDR